MVWYKYLYAEEDLRPKQEKIKWKILHNAGQVHMYVIALSRSPGGLLEIISTVELMQRAYPKERLFIVGLARGYENACKLACRIVLEVFEKTGDFRVREYLLAKHRGEGERVSL